LNVTFTCSGPDRGGDVQSLREWLPKAAPGLPLRFVDTGPDSGNHLGVSVEELCAVVSGVADLTALVAAVRGWVRNRFGRNAAEDRPPVVTTGPVTRIEVGTVVITITQAPGEQAPTIGPDAR
jgi:hypothetical protein